MIFVKRNPSKLQPLFDVMTGSPMIIQGNHFRVATAVRIKAPGAVLIGNAFHLGGPYKLAVDDERYTMAGDPGNIVPGRYDFSHFIRPDSGAIIRAASGTTLTRGEHYHVLPVENAFEITAVGKKELDRSGTADLLVSYTANDAGHVGFQAWGENGFNPPGGWRSRELTLLANKIVFRAPDGEWREAELTPVPNEVQK
jgi:hypothetical protein